MIGEFDLISRYFAELGTPSDRVRLGVGDDAAILDPGSFSPGARSSTLTRPGHGSEAARRLVNTCVWRLAENQQLPMLASLAVALPAVDIGWIEAFSAALDQSLKALETPLIGGDTTRGEFCVSLFLHGQPTALARGPDTAAPAAGSKHRQTLVEFWHVNERAVPMSTLRWLLAHQTGIAALAADACFEGDNMHIIQQSAALRSRLALPKQCQAPLRAHLQQRGTGSGALALVEPSMIAPRSTVWSDGDLKFRVILPELEI